MGRSSLVRRSGSTDMRGHTAAVLHGNTCFLINFDNNIAIDIGGDECGDGDECDFGDDFEFNEIAAALPLTVLVVLVR